MESRWYVSVIINIFVDSLITDVLLIKLDMSDSFIMYDDYYHLLYEVLQNEASFRIQYYLLV